MADDIQTTDIRQHIYAATHGDPPDRKCLPGSDDKWEGYQLGVDEAASAAEAFYSAAAAERDELRAERNRTQALLHDYWLGDSRARAAAIDPLSKWILPYVEKQKAAANGARP